MAGRDGTGSVTAVSICASILSLRSAAGVMVNSRLTMEKKASTTHRTMKEVRAPLVRVVVPVLAIIIAVIVITVLLTALQVYLREDESGKSDVELGQLLETVADNFARRGGPARHIDSCVDLLRDQGRVYDCHDWRRIDNHQFILCLEGRQQFFHLMRAEQILRVYRLGAGNDHIGAAGILLDGFR